MIYGTHFGMLPNSTRRGDLIPKGLETLQMIQSKLSMLP